MLRVGERQGIRPWISHLNDNVGDLRSAQAFCTHEWRDLLNASTTVAPQAATALSRSKRPPKHENAPTVAKKTVGTVFFETVRANVIDYPIPQFWRGHPLATLSGSVLPTDKHSVCTIRWITWELHEVAFRHELGELDKYLSPVSAKDVEALHQRRALTVAMFAGDLVADEDSLPVGTAGLGCTDPVRRAPYLEALRCLLVRWPGVPPDLVTSLPFTALTSPIRFTEIEGKLTCFYCQSFYECCGRPPILPRCIPPI